MERVLDELVAMSRYLGDPAKAYAILGEGNTSARAGDDAFYVKASGTMLGEIDASGFVEVSISRVTAVLDDPDAGDDAVTETFKRSLLHPNERRRPSVEAMLHALLYAYPEVNFVGHTHPVYTNMLLCSLRAEEAVAGRICPDHVVVMAHKSLYIPYVDPGLILARNVRDRLAHFVREENMLPLAIMMQSHGMIALGKTAKEVTGITDMAEKASQIIQGAYALGGPRFMPDGDVKRIFTRPDEKYRQKVMGSTPAKRPAKP